MTKEKILFEDKAGNKLVSRIIKSRDTTQYFARNREGDLVSYPDVLKLAKKAKINLKGVRERK